MKEDKFWHPLITGFLLGTAIFVSFMVAGQGMGASGAFARAGAQLAYLQDSILASSTYVKGYLKHGNALANWTVVEVVGIFIGAYISAAFAGRIKQGFDRGERVSIYKRALLAFIGGIIIAVATRLARGCTSGQAIDGASTFSVGAWIFMLAVFGAGFAFAPLFRRFWKGAE
jgi:uncharacterized membrane protein YedE/YeeE